MSDDPWASDASDDRKRDAPSQRPQKRLCVAGGSSSSRNLAARGDVDDECPWDVEDDEAVAGATMENDDPWAVEESQDPRQAQTAVSLTPASLALVSRSSGDPKTKYAIQGMDAAKIKERLIRTRCCRCKTN